MATIIKKNYKSDFDATLHLKSCVGDVCKEVGWPDYDWVARFYTTSHDNVYIASNIGGVLTNCFNDNGNIHVVFNNHGLSSGTLRVEFSAEIPNEIYPDGSQLEVSPQALNIELVRGVGDCGTIADVEVMLSYIKGDPFTYEDFTESQIKELQKPATEAAESVKVLENTVSDSEALRVSAEQKRISDENERKASESIRQGNETIRQGNETIRETNEAGRVSAEQSRAEEFAAWESEIDSKADRSELSNVFAEESLTPDNFPDINIYTREELKMDLFIDMWNTAAGSYGTYNAETGCFELNGITDMTYNEALKIYDYYIGTINEISVGQINPFPAKEKKLRTCMPYTTYQSANLRNFAPLVDIIVFTHYYGDGVHAVNMRQSFLHTRRVLTPIVVNRIAKESTEGFYSAFNANLEYILLKGLNINLPLSSCPKIERYCIEYAVQKAANTNPITIKVHPDVYAKLADETNTEWHALLALAAEKNITFATV